MLDLIQAASESTADGIKFQVLIDPASFISSCHPFFNDLAMYVFSREQWLQFFSLSKSLGLKIVAMPCDYKAFDLCASNSALIDYIEMHSVNLRDEIAMLKAKGVGLPIILGIGGRYVDEVDQYVLFFGSILHSLVVGFQSFPTNPSDICLERIKFLSAKYPHLLIGYADHTSGSDQFVISLCTYALTLGAEIFELHIGLSGLMNRVDSNSAHSQPLLSVLFESLRKLKSFEHDPDLVELRALTNAEKAYRVREKKVVLNHSMKSGQVVDIDDICLKMTGSTDGFPLLEDVVGRRLNKNIAFDSPLTEKDFDH